MKIDDLKQLLDSLVGCITFDYLGKACGIDPINHSHYEMWFGDKGKTATSIDEVMNDQFFDGKSLAEIADEIIIIDW